MMYSSVLPRFRLKSARCSYDNYRMDGERVTGIRGHARNGATVTEEARLVVGADGKHSLVARSVEAPMYATTPPEAAHKVGESTVEIAAHYLRDILGLEEHLHTQHVRKFGLRMFFSFDGNQDITRSRPASKGTKYSSPCCFAARSR